MRLVDLDAKKPYVLDGRYVIDVMPHVDIDFDAIREEIEKKMTHGHWISDEDGNLSCSVCGQHGVGDNYCEKCGAKMDEVIEV